MNKFVIKTFAENYSDWEKREEINLHFPDFADMKVADVMKVLGYVK